MHSHVVMVALLTVACGAATTSTLPVGTTTTTGGVSNDPGGLGVPQGLRESPPRIVLGDDAAAQLASTHCMHEDACGNVGPSGMFSTFDVCVDAVRTSQASASRAPTAREAWIRTRSIVASRTRAPKAATPRPRRAATIACAVDLSRTSADRFDS